MLSPTACKRALNDRGSRRLFGRNPCWQVGYAQGAVRADVRDSPRLAHNPRGQHSGEYVAANPGFICQSVNASFGATLHREVVKTLRSRGHEIDDCNLYAERFDPVLSGRPAG
jgi:hypothetical protein